ncbi:DNA recombination protein RmuC [Agrococcus jejuensis]|uniref:DNA recombination protein RmuC n=1 Tax=Agrococcus jejuensis TaxID=399736 RepID=UPI0011AAB662|nr:DNA recombination protein RmuC [Agrococcus jejuensis]
MDLGIPLALLVALLVGAAAGWLACRLVARAKAGEATLAAQQAEQAQALAEQQAAQHEAFARQQELHERERLDAELAGLHSAHESLAAQHRDAIDARDAAQRERASLSATVEALREQLEVAKSAADESTQRERRESRVAEQIAPMKEAVTKLQTQLVELERQRSEQHGSIAQQLQQSLQSEERLRATADSLASALSSNSTRGVWGETQLRRVVEAAGLLERVDFDTQTSFTSDERRQRPDMVVHLPGGKHLALDAKVPFRAYLEASRIPLTASDEELARRASLMQEHVKALRAHVDQLSSKQYWAGIANSPEFVVAFIPSESLVSAALEADPGIMDYAFGKRVALSSPVSLWSLLKSVAITWSQAAVAEDAARVHELSQELYDRIATMAGHVEKVRSSLESSVKHFNAFSSSLESRVLVSARKLARLDAPKQIVEPSEIDHAPKPLTAAEFTDLAIEAPAAESEQVVDGEVVETDADAATTDESAASRTHADLAIDELLRDESSRSVPRDDDASQSRAG